MNFTIGNIYKLNKPFLLSGHRYDYLCKTKAIRKVNGQLIDDESWFELFEIYWDPGKEKFSLEGTLFFSVEDNDWKDPCIDIYNTSMSYLTCIETVDQLQDLLRLFNFKEQANIDKNDLEKCIRRFTNA